MVEGLISGDKKDGIPRNGDCKRFTEVRVLE